MKIVSWNCQGLAKPAAIRALRFMLWESKPDILFLCEVKTHSLSPILQALFQSNLIKHFSLPPTGNSGGLIIAWNNITSLTVEISNKNFIHSSVSDNLSSVTWLLTTVYAPCIHSNKASFWNSIDNINIPINTPWLVIGDFNAISSQSDKKGGQAFVCASSHNLTYQLDSLGLIDLGFSGYPYTWSNKRTGFSNIQQRLDRGVANSDWITLFPLAAILHLTALSSDHSPILLTTCPEQKVHYPFRFENMWTEENSCFDAVKEGWVSKDSGSPPFILNSKIRNVKSSLKAWNKSHFGNCLQRVKDIKARIDDIQYLDKTDTTASLERGLLVELDTWMVRADILWKQRAKDKWLKEGDKNSRYFHITATIHSRSNKIGSIKDLNNISYFNRDDIGNCFMNFYNTLFKTDFIADNLPFPPNLNNLIPTCISNEDNIILSGLPSSDSIKKTVFSFSNFKSPGPDGLPPSFFKSFWFTTHADVVKSAEHFFKTGFLLKALNSTFITLIPKNRNANRVDHFRPISLCNTTYKTVSKILAQRLKAVLPKCISQNQFAFIKNKNIHENTVIAQEIMHFLHKRRGPSGYMAIKVDLIKAFDRVEWPFLLCILENFGFCNSFISWIKQCITTTNLSFLINGAPFGNLKPSRGIRQGDPLSPFLFILYIEILSRLLAAEENAQNFKGIKVSRASPTITHLLFADDVVIYCRANMNDALCIKKVLDCFTLWTNQKPNTGKSMIHFSSNTDTATKSSILNCLGFIECNHKNTHLGLPFCKTVSRKFACNAVLENLTNKLTGWKSKALSQASRSVLIKAVSLAIPSYHMSMLMFPKDVCDNMDRLIRKFWWGVNSNGNSLCLKTWESICSPKSLGGLGFRKMRDTNTALLAKMAWDLVTNKDHLWIKLIKSKYLRGKSFLHDDLNSHGCSWFWKDLSSCRDLIASGAVFYIDQNSDVAIWIEPWIPSIKGFIPNQSACPNLLSLNLVRDLIDHGSLSWNLHTLNATFSPELVKEITKIQISSGNRQKTLFWSPSMSGNFSTKSAYLLSLGLRFNQPSFSRNINWNLIWSSPIHNRFKLLLWKILNNIIPCKSKLNSLFALPNTNCLFCNGPDENLDHIFMLCPYIQQLWFSSYWHFNIACFSHMTVAQWIMFIFDKKCPLFSSNSTRLEFIVFNVILWDKLWFNRNLSFHGGSVLTPTNLLSLVTKQAKDHWLALAQVIHNGSSHNLVWKPPPDGWIKINTDATFANGDSTSGIVFKNKNGSILLAATSLHRCNDAATAECLAILEACRLAASLKIKNAIFSSDCLNVIAFINSTPLNSFWAVKPVVEQIKRVWTSWPCWVFKHSNRATNYAAHFLAKWGASSGFVGIIPCNNIPISVFCDVGYPLIDSICNF